MVDWVDNGVPKDLLIAFSIFLQRAMTMENTEFDDR
jgi:hypothetical protein